MTGDCPEFIEAIRLTRDFFPEAKPYISLERGLHWDHLWQALLDAGARMDFSCDSGCHRPGEHALVHKLHRPEVVSDDEIYRVLLEHTGFSPTGRVVVIPDASWRPGFVPSARLPFVCSSQTVATRLHEYDDLFFQGNDTVFVFESGEAFLLNHDEKFIWAKSKQRKG
ncbi:hypothetical protein [Armatimonas rosea]|uniref:Uncharacterized protein n=1 Tax=Armatimonas rosea TaxID=685828 RepID=A0A7W9SQI3_ARMRO|nr:hypothetical protein [Armatimonas rosea]MBB6050173.1 hypothetical protein [Armatimonas rosea]